MLDAKHLDYREKKSIMYFRLRISTPKGHDMFLEYLDKLRMYGKRHFTFQEIIQDLHISENAAKSGVFRLKKVNKIITPIKRLYVMVPPEYQPYGSIPAEELVPIIMKHLNVDYYVGLLSAGLFYGATHQKPARFQVITNKRIKHPLKFGDVVIELIYKDSSDMHALLPVELNWNFEEAYQFVVDNVISRLP